MKLIFLISSVWAAVVINQSVGLIGNDVVTLRETQMAVVIEKLLESPEAKNPTLFEVQLKDTRMPELTSAYLLERAAVIEAKSFSIGQANDEEIKNSVALIEKAVAGKSYWRSLDPTPELVKEILATKLTARNFIKIKSESMSSIVTDAEALAYFEKNRMKFGSSPFESFKENIKTFLAQQQRQERLRAWVEILKKKYKVRNLLSENLKTPEQTAETQNPPPGN